MNRENMKLDNEHDLNQRENGKVLGKIIISIIIIFILFILFIISYFIINDIRLNQEKENVGKRAEQIATEKLKEKYSERSFEIIGTNVYVHPASFGSSAYVDRSHVIVLIKENNEEYSVAVNVGSETISSDNIQEKENLKNQAEQIATAKLKEKYPERNFEITDIIVTERVSYDVALDKNEIIVYIKDNYNNGKYTVIVNCENGKISDNIQANEITEAIKEKLNEILKIDSDTIEFDVWLTKDKVPVIFHGGDEGQLSHNFKVEDKTLLVNNTTLEEMRKLEYLKDSEQKIPTLEEVLDLVRGKIAILIELKFDTKLGKLEKEVASILDNYNGEFAVQSFNPLSILWFRINRKEFIRGYLVNSIFCKNPLMNGVLNKTILNTLLKPNFIAVNLLNFKPVISLQFFLIVSHKLFICSHSCINTF